MNGVVYLLHFEKKISAQHSTQHYTGWALDLHARIAEHRAGRGARLTQVAVERGIRFEVVRTWIGSREFERQIKNRKAGPRLCPICNVVHRPNVPHIDICQLELPLAEPFPEPPKLTMDSYEFLRVRSFREARVPQLSGREDWDEGLL